MFGINQFPDVNHLGIGNGPPFRKVYKIFRWTLFNEQSIDNFKKAGCLVTPVPVTYEEAHALVKLLLEERHE